MLFRKKMERSCAYCSRAVKIDEDTMICVKRGVVCPEDACRRFRYDPLKRIPEPAGMELPLGREDADYSL